MMSILKGSEIDMMRGEKRTEHKLLKHQNSSQVGNY